MSKLKSTMGRMERPSTLLQEFCEWMHRHRGVRASTLDDRSRVVRAFLEATGGSVARLGAASIRAFVLNAARGRSPASAKNVVAALRAFLRFLIAGGLVPAELIDAVPTVAAWRLAALPRYLTASEVERVLGAVDRSTPAGLRDRAVLFLLWRLGLRAGEVAALCFDDFDWTGGTVRVGLSGKGRRETRLPLPQDAGDAVLAYLERGRPVHADPHIFLRARRPLSRQAVATVVVRTALRRAGLRMPSEGAHLLRHSLATHLLRQGQPLQAIAAVLRHRSIEMTAHYAKVDVTRLALIAQPWPEVTSC